MTFSWCFRYLKVRMFLLLWAKLFLVCDIPLSLRPWKGIDWLAASGSSNAMYIIEWIRRYCQSTRKQLLMDMRNSWWYSNNSMMKTFGTASPREWAVGELTRNDFKMLFEAPDLTRSFIGSLSCRSIRASSWKSIEGDVVLYRITLGMWQWESNCFVSWFVLFVFNRLNYFSF